MIAVVPELDDETFDSFLPNKIREKSFRFFTPVSVALKAARWLSGKDRRVVLDIGAGVGKFCLVGAKKTKSKFVGVEARKHLVGLAETIFKQYNTPNARLINTDVRSFPISKYRAFYLYNPFGENIATHLRLDDHLELSPHNFGNCVSFIYSQLMSAKIGSRLVTYHGSTFQVPGCFSLVQEHENGKLKFWVKES